MYCTYRVNPANLTFAENKWKKIYIILIVSLYLIIFLNYNQLKVKM